MLHGGCSPLAAAGGGGVFPPLDVRAMAHYFSYLVFMRCRCDVTNHGCEHANVPTREAGLADSRGHSLCCHLPTVTSGGILLEVDTIDSV